MINVICELYIMNQLLNAIWMRLNLEMKKRFQWDQMRARDNDDVAEFTIYDEEI